MPNIKFLVFILLILMPGASASNLTISASAFPMAVQYQPYSSTALSASGGVPPYTWSVTTADSTLPEGMTINPATGVISSAAVGGQGGYQFQVQVKDAAGTIATALETIPQVPLPDSAPVHGVDGPLTALWRLAMVAL